MEIQDISQLPDDADVALLIGRVWCRTVKGPVPVLVRERNLVDISSLAPTISQLLELENVVELLKEFDGPILGSVKDVMQSPACSGKIGPVKMLAPIDLQCIKACGVTFAVSALERIVEEQAKGDANAAQKIRQQLIKNFGDTLANVTPGSSDANQIKKRLQAQGLWSQYLEVAIGPDAEVFTKAAVLSAVGWGDYVGIRPDSSWNNPEPEVVLVCNSRGEIAGATLGNDVNLRDFEGRSALLLGKGKDNNASASLGPFIRLFDDTFSMSTLREEVVSLSVKGEDGFSLNAENSMTLISREPEDLVAQTYGADHHQYPDGFVLFLGSLFAPTHDRGTKGQGFTHHIHDEVRISSPHLGCLFNKVCLTSTAPSWEFGVVAMMKNLAARGLI